MYRRCIDFGLSLACLSSPVHCPPMRIVRWLLLLFYLALVGGLFAMAVHGEEWSALVPLAVTVASLAVFILGAGHKDLCRPIRRPRLLMPVAAASLMLAVLVAGLTLALGELFRLQEQDSPGGSLLFWGVLLATWVFWGVLLYAHTQNMPRYQAISQIARLLFAGSVAEMLAAVPSHIVVSRRPGCLVGLATAIGILSGLYVMLWSFGPAIFLLFLHAGRRGEVEDTDEAGEADPVDQPPAPQTPFQFSLRTMLLVMLATGVACGLLRMFWGYLPAAVVAAWVTLMLLLPLLTAHRAVLAAGLVAALCGTVWVFWGEWNMLAVLVLPTGILGLVLLKVALAPVQPT
jgi:hypothetical protein